MYPPLQAAILPAKAGFLDSDGYLPDNGLVSRGLMRFRNVR